MPNLQMEILLNITNIRSHLKQYKFASADKKSQSKFGVESQNENLVAPEVFENAYMVILEVRN